MTEFDDARLAELLEIFGKEDFALVVEAFLEEAGRAVATLADMIGSGPDPVREAQMHYLVGSARNLGAASFGDLCRHYQLSRAAFTDDDYAVLTRAFRETSEAFGRKLQEQIDSAA